MPNLTRRTRSIELIESLVTHADYQNKGLGRKIMEHAITFARNSNSYKVILLSNIKREASHKFYKSIGFISDEKVGFAMNF